MSALTTVRFPLRSVAILDDGRTPDEREAAQRRICERYEAGIDPPVSRWRAPFRIKRLTPEEWEDIYARVEIHRESYTDVARFYGCSSATVPRIIKQHEARIRTGAAL